MSEQKTFTLPKQERLCSRTLIEQLFLGHSQHKKEWPVRVVYQVVKRKDEDDAQAEVLMSVSKRYFKRAVKRNLVKRQLRESYRLHKAILLSGQTYDSVKVEKAVKAALEKIVDSLER